MPLRRPGCLASRQQERDETSNRKAKNPEGEDTHTTGVQESPNPGQLAFSLTQGGPFQVPRIGRDPLDPSSPLGYGLLDRPSLHIQPLHRNIIRLAACSVGISLRDHTSPYVQPKGARMEKKLILVVENDEDLRHLLVDALNHGDRHVVEAGNAYEAFERIARRSPLLIVTDLQMPGGGLEYLAQLRHRFPSSAIVAITAGRSELGRTEVLAHGATAYLEKPIRMKQVRATVDALLNRPLT